MVGKFLLGMVSGGVLVSGGLVVGTMLFPTRPANDNLPAAPTEDQVVAPQATVPDTGSSGAAATAPAEPVTAEAAPTAPESDTEKVADPAPTVPAPAPEVSDEAPAAPEGDTAAAGPAPSAPSAEVAKPETGVEPSKPATAEADPAATADVAAPVVAAEVDPAASPDATQLADAGAAVPVEPATAPKVAAEAAPEAPTPEPAAEATEAPSSAPTVPEAETSDAAAAPSVATEAPATGPTESAAGVEAPASADTPAVTDAAPETATEQAPAAEAPAAEPALDPTPVAPATDDTALPDPATDAPPAEPPAPELPTGEAPPAAPVVEPAPDASSGEAAAPDAPAPEVADDPAGTMPAPTEVTPGTPVPDMPGQKPEALPGSAEAPDTALAEAGTTSTFKPAPGLIRAGEGLIIGRDTPTEAAPADASAGPADTRPLARFAVPFENPEARPPLAIVLVDPGTAELDREALSALPFPVTFALDPLDPASAQRAEIYRAGDKEVVMLVTGIAQGAQASDVEVAFQSMEQGLPQAVAVMDLAEPTFQNNRLLASAVVPILKAQGRGLLTWDEGLNAADQVARRDDLEAAVVFRNLDQAGGDGVALRRLLDRAVFKADQDGRVSVVGTADPATVAALLEWTVEGKAATVALAPLSAVLSVE